MEYNKVDYSRYYVQNRPTYIGDSEEHTIEYIGGDNAQNPKPTRRHRRHNIKGTLLTISIIVVMCLVIIIIADSLRGGYVLGAIKSLVKSGEIEKTYYGVECRVYDDIESARLYSNTLRRKGGAGYVIFDDGYRVLVEMYSDKDDATEIAKKLKLDGENARVYKMDILSADYLLFPEKTRNAVKSAVEFNDRVYRNLYDIGVLLARENIDENSAKMKIEGLATETRNVLAEYESNVDSDIGNSNIVKVKAELESILATLDNLSGDRVKRPNLLADIRYTSCLIVNAYRELSSELQRKGKI